MNKNWVFSLVLLVSACGSAVGPEREYRYVHMETTGLTEGIFIGSGISRPPNRPAGFPDVMIVFADDSNRDAVESLRSLDDGIYLANANANTNGIVIVGVLDPTIRHISGATSEPYQEFRLSRWYLRAPFPRYRRLQTPVQPAVVEYADQLKPDDFGGRVGGDLSRFVRAR